MNNGSPPLVTVAQRTLFERPRIPANQFSSLSRLTSWWSFEEGHPGVKSTKAVDDFLLKLLPLSMRGKELRKMQGQQGLASVLWTEYENVTISEVSQGQGRTGVTVIFTNEKC
jgi:hypothetical protein